MTNKDFFNVIGSVGDDLIKEASVRKRRKRAVIKWASAAAAFLLVAATALTVTLNLPKPQTTDTISVTNKRYLKVTTYVGKDSTQQLTADTMPVLESKELVTERVITLPQYNLLSSNVPGFPFTFDPDGNKLELSVDNGTLCSWDQKSGKVTTLGKDCVMTEKSTVYWSPLEADGSQSAAAKDAKITVKTIAINGSNNGDYKLNIGSDNNLYSVSLKEVD